MSLAAAKVGLFLDLVEYIKSQAEGVPCDEAMERCPIRSADHQAGWLVNELRREGFLIQVEDNTLFILPDAPCRTGMWMRHPEYGVVKVSWARDGFPMVRVRKLGTVSDLGNEFRVRREELLGR